jgi:hypothetical protein
LLFDGFKWFFYFLGGWVGNTDEKDYHFGQGLILYNQYKYWANWLYTVADAIRVGDDLSRFQLQYSYFHRPVFGAHGSFLLTNGLVENAVTWDLGSLTEDYQFAMKAWARGFYCGKVCGIIREQSPMDFMGFMKQRRRWYCGIRRLPHLLPRIWVRIGVSVLVWIFLDDHVHIYKQYFYSHNRHFSGLSVYFHFIPPLFLFHWDLSRNILLPDGLDF